MATLTASAAFSGVQAKSAGHGQTVTVFSTFNSSSTAVSDSATTVLMAKVPNKSTITNIAGDHTIGAATCPTDYGIQGSLSAFASGVTIGALTVTNGVLPFDVSVSDDATNQFVYVTATPTAGTSTTSFKCNLRITYVMD
jgi:hypothetical protein